jgi:hypothetical protein
MPSLIFLNFYHQQMAPTVSLDIAFSISNRYAKGQDPSRNFKIKAISSKTKIINSDFRRLSPLSDSFVVQKSQKKSKQQYYAYSSKDIIFKTIYFINGIAIEKELSKPSVQMHRRYKIHNANAQAI